MIELFPVVVFYSLNPGEKVQIRDMKESKKSKLLGCGDYNGNCSPLNETICQHIVNLIQSLYEASSKEHILGVEFENDTDTDIATITRRPESWRQAIQKTLLKRLTPQKLPILLVVQNLPNSSVNDSGFSNLTAEALAKARNAINTSVVFMMSLGIHKGAFL